MPRGKKDCRGKRDSLQAGTGCSEKGGELPLKFNCAFEVIVTMYFFIP